MNKNKFYVTTPIYYVNSKPHLGTLYTTLLADIVARWNKLQGKKVFFLTGTDEHGQKIQERAEELEIAPKTLADSVVGRFKKMWQKYDIECDKFIRTTDKEHEKAVVKWIKKLQKQGDIYKSYYSGWYCVPCETFVPVNLEETEQDSKGNYLCPSCNRELRKVSEESYFFRLSAYQDQLLKFYEKFPDFITPKERLNEVVSFVKSDLRDLSISRKTVKWGIPFPEDKEHTVYVWGDALNNYISAIGYGQDDLDIQKRFNFWWPADLHIIGKDILRFHAVYWPAFLMAAGLELPKKLLVHGFILMDEQKMSKSLGNVIDPKMLSEWYGSESVRYYLARQMSVNQDGHFSLLDLENRISADLSNNLGNLLNRMLSLAIDNVLTEVKVSEKLETDSILLKEKCEEAFRSYWDAMNHCQYHVALAELWRFISKVNAYFHSQKPWIAAKKDKKLFLEIISVVCHSLYSIAIMLWPVMPKKMEELLACLGCKVKENYNYDEELRKNVWNKTFILKKTEKPIFPRPESHVTQEEVQEKEETSKTITINDFLKVELIVGTIIECKLVEKSNKLYQMKVDMGKLGTRQVVAGVAKEFKPEELIGKQGIYVGNLAPRKMMGLESKGMMLFAKDSKGNYEMATVSGKVENGMRLC